jgi:hypothetical protein
LPKVLFIAKLASDSMAGVSTRPDINAWPPE